MSQMKQDDLFPPLDFPALRLLLKDLFSLREVTTFQWVHGGFMSQNFKVETNQGPFFLKQYRNRMNTIVHEIKMAEEYFSEEGLPIILPIKDRYARRAFWLNGHWFGLFPFIDGQMPIYGKMTNPQIISLASTLAKFHEAGKRYPYRPFQLLRVGNREKFHMEKVELERQIHTKPLLNPIDESILALLSKKEEIIKRTNLTPMDFPLSYTSLLHGDYQYMNVFVQPDGQVSHVYDLERACIGPAEFEVVRSLLLNCYDDGWTEKNDALARTYLSQYQATQPLTFDAFYTAMRFYGYNITMMSWIESRYVIYGMAAQLEIYERHARRVDFFANADLREFCERIYPK